MKTFKIAILILSLYFLNSLQAISNSFIEKYNDVMTIGFDTCQNLTSKMALVFDSITFTCQSITYIEPCKKGIGDVSHILYVDYENNEDEIFLNHIKASISKESAWQIYLLANLQHWLPVFWHGGYQKRIPILSNDEKTSILNKERFSICSDTDSIIETGCLTEKDYEILQSLKVKEPTITIDKTNNKAEVKCCYWNDWRGLVQETMSLQFGNQGTVQIVNIDSSVLFEYDCGIIF